VLVEAELDPTFAIGGILQTLGTNGKAGKGDYFVAEADESDGSFLRTKAAGAIVTNLENDHLDYWGTAEKLDKGFQQFFDQSENVFWCADDLRLRKLRTKGTSYGFSADADLRISHFRQTEKGIIFDLNEHQNIELSLFGEHNALNGAAVFALALSLDVPEASIRSAFHTFKGTARRLEWKGEERKVALYDDYGHHPTEISATLKALREIAKERRLVAIFQPHRFTRVRDQDFSKCFDEADVVFLTEIYGAGEAPIPGITTEALHQKLGNRFQYVPRGELEKTVAKELRPLDVVVTLGAGDITRAGIPILNEVKNLGKKIKVGLLFGGPSAENPVSVMSAQNVHKALDPEIYDTKLFEITKEGEWKRPMQELTSCDVCIPVFHGPQGEDGMIQGLLDTLNIPYVGCDYRSGAICMHKGWTKYVAIMNNIPTTPFIETDLLSYRRDPDALLKKITNYPVWIKPVHLGSSIGVSRAAGPEEVAKCMELALHYDDIVIIEQEVLGRQIEFGVIGNDWVRIGLPSEYLNEGEFVGYDDKYGSTAMAIQTAPLTEAELKVGLELAEKMYRACDCKGLARVDFFLDNNGYYWMNEVNPFPGCTDTSAYPILWKNSGLSMDKVVDEWIACAFQRSRKLARVRGK
jgi:UDP-N-acetylmuramate--alanine ligase